MVAIRQILRRARRCEAGAEFVEFALAFPMLLLVVMGIVDFGMMFQQYQVLTNAAREGARVGVLPGYTTTQAQTRACDYIAASFMGATCPTVSVTVLGPTAVCIGTNSMSVMTVNASYLHNYLFIGGIMKYFTGGTYASKTLNASASMRVEIASAGTCP
jgi:Flp pilus assembly protein TadG